MIYGLAMLVLATQAGSAAVDGLSLPPGWQTLTPPALLGLFVLLMMLGRIHTNTAYQAQVKALEIERAANRKLLSAVEAQARTIEKQTVFGELGAKTMKAIGDEADGVSP